jgi:hypothetical protein
MAYEKLIEWGVPCRKYVQQELGDDGLFKSQPLNEGEIIFDNDLIAQGEDATHDKLYWQFRGKSSMGRYWDSWTRESRSHPLVIRVVEELGEAADGKHAKLRIVEIPDGTDYEISEYDGQEHIAEKHRTWG